MSQTIADTDLLYTPAAKAAALIRSRKLSPVEYVDTVLKAIDHAQPKLNCFREVMTDAARRDAKAAEQAVMDGKPLGPLHGVPVSIKDLLDVKGVPTRHGSAIFADNPPAAADDVLVERLRKAGAIIIGKANSPEFGVKGLTDGPSFGITRNPWNLERTPGGSSGGAGAAVAAGLGPIAIGTDGGGSVRIPGSFNGLVGLKATFGRIAAWPPSMTGDLANTGPMARTAVDCALMMNAIARPDARDPYSLPADGTDYAKKVGGKLKKLKVGFVLRFGEHPLDIEVAAMLTKAAKQFEALGCKVEEAEAPFSYPEAGRAFVIHWLTALQRLLTLFPEERHHEFDPNLLATAKAGLRYSLQDVVNAQVTRRELAIAWNLFFAKYDLLLTPTVAVKPFAAGQNLPEGPDGKPNMQWSPYTSQFNLTRHPAATVPCGLSSDGLPIGLHIVSGHYRDALVLRAAARYAEAHPLKFPVLPETK